jgi:hypothetical protein
LRSLTLAFLISTFCLPGLAQITVSSPSSTTVSSPTKFVATAKSTSGVSITTFKIYIDNISKYSIQSGSISTSLSMSAGAHNVVFQAWDSKGTVYKKSMFISVSSTTSGDTSSSNSYTNIDEMSGWESCDVCAGAGGSGPTTPYSLAQHISSPSMDGNSAKFWIGGSTPYSQALWWKHLTATPSAHHFVYDSYFYLTNSSAPQALEFDVNQSANGKHFIFGTQCDIRKTKQFDVWDDINEKFVATGVACPAPSAYKWHHLVWEFERTTDNRVKYVSVTLDGVKHYINMSYATRSSSASSLSAAFQMDGNYLQTDYSTWLDKVKLTYW